MTKKTSFNTYIFAIFLFIFPLNSCNSQSEKTRNNEPNGTIKPSNTKLTVPIKDLKIGKVVFYLENSESMFGYVNGITEYVKVVSELSEKPEFAAEKTKREFYFINGGSELKITILGKDPSVLKTKLTKTGFNSGDITKSNLTSMFQKALEKAQNDTISILISDAIYDIGQQQSPENALVFEGNETRSKFINRIENGDLQTLLIKLYSNFNGTYFFSSRSGKTTINQSRPYYIWVFGKSELLNKYFSEEYISQKLLGYDNFARFIVINANKNPYQIVTSINRIGDFRVDRENKNKIIKAEPRHGEFQFCFAVDFSSIPFSDKYLTIQDNYHCNNPNFKILKVERIKDNQKFEVTSFVNPTHVITIYTDKNPNGLLEIVLKNEIPIWIKETDIINEDQIDNSHTFGFKYLTGAISEAYSHRNKGKQIAEFNIEISK